MRVLRAVVKLSSILQSEQGGGTVINAGARRDTAALGGPGPRHTIYSRDCSQHTQNNTRPVMGHFIGRASINIKSDKILPNRSTNSQTK